MHCCATRSRAHWARPSCPQSPSSRWSSLSLVGDATTTSPPSPPSSSPLVSQTHPFTRFFYDTEMTQYHFHSVNTHIAIITSAAHMHPFSRSSVHSFIHSFIYSFTHSLIHPCSLPACKALTPRTDEAINLVETAEVLLPLRRLLCDDPIGWPVVRECVDNVLAPVNASSLHQSVLPELRLIKVSACACMCGGMCMRACVLDCRHCMH